MSGGRLVVLDRAGRDVKRFPLAEGLATLGSDPSCDIRIMLPMVSPHHATVAVHANQTVVRNVCEGETLVNGRCVSVAALRHGDLISIGGRHLRWDYSDPTVRRPQAPEPALYVSRRKGRGPRRGSGPAGASARDPALQLALEMSHRASMPGTAGGKQVAIVQPQRRDTSEQIDRSPRTPPSAAKRARAAHAHAHAQPHAHAAKRKSSARAGPNTALPALQNTTKATLWIESRKTSPRKSNKIQTPTTEPVVKLRRNTASAKKSTPLRLTVLKRAQSAQKSKVTKIEAPLKIDHTKQAAILLMTGHTAKSKQSGPSPSPRAPTLVVKRPRPARRSARDRTVTILEITDSDGRNSSVRNSTIFRRSGQKSPKKSPAPQSPRKSALKNPLAKRGTRKTESIKFDLSNLASHSQDTEILMVTDTTKQSYEGDSASDDDITLRYSESSGVQSPSPRRSIHSRSSKILEKTLGTTVNVSPPSRTLTPESPQRRRSLRGSMILQKALNQTETESYSRRTTKSVSDKSQNTTVASAYRTRTLSPRTPRNDLESYSIVDLVSIDTDESARSTSVYDSVGSNDVTATFSTTFNGTGRKTRSTIDPSTLLGSSTPYVKAARSSRSSTSRSRSSPNVSSNTSVNGSQSTTRSSKTRRSKSLSTPENTEDAKKQISVNSTRISRASRSRSRINDSDLLLLDDDDDSPRTSKRISTTSKSTRSSVHIAGNTPTNATSITSPAENEGTSTPENRHSPEEASTPVLSIKSLLDSSQSSLASQRSTRRGRPTYNTKRKTIGVITGPKTRVGIKSKSISFSARKTRLRLSSDSVEVLNNTDDSQHDSEIVTPKSAVKLVQEGVKNKHSTAKKPQSKRSMIDDLNESDIVKQLFNSPVKRKLSQSMTEFSRKQLFDDDDVVQVKRPTRYTIAITGRTPDNSLLNNTESYTPERFVSPISTPTNSPNLDGIKLMFAQTTPENDLRNVTGIKGLLRTPRTRRSIKNDLTNVSGVKTIFAKSPKNRLSDVRVKEVFATSPKNDLRRVTGVKSLFQSTKKRMSPRNELEDVRGVKKLFNTRSPVNDLRNVSGVKRTLRQHSPRNDLSDLRGVKRMFRKEKRNDLNDVSGVEELFNVSNQSHRDAESLFDQLIGKPQIRAVYSKTFSTKTVNKTKQRNRKSLHASLDKITNNVEEWLEQELNKRLQKAIGEASTSKSANKDKSNMTRELQKLVTDTVEGNAPILTSRVRNSTITRIDESDTEHKKSASELYSAHTLPLKKRSLVERSIEKANDSRANNLPIKKRVVVHSTPVKGRVNVTMNASVLGRVSPIAADDDGPEASVGSSQQPKQQMEVRPRSRRGTRAKTDTLEITNTSEFVKPSPKNTRAKAVAIISPKDKPASPAKEKAAAAAKEKAAAAAKEKAAAAAKEKAAAAANEKATAAAKEKATATAKEKAAAAKVKKSSPVKTKVASPVSKSTYTKVKVVSPDKSKQVSPAKAKKSSLAKVTKRSPAKAKELSLAAGPAKAKNLSPAPSPVQVKITRTRRKDISATKANATKHVATVVIAKKSPVMSPKPRTTRKRKDPETSTTPKPSPKKTRATRKNAEIVVEKPKTPKTTRAKVQKATVVISKPSPQLKPRATKTRGQSESESDITRKTRRTVIIEEKVVSPKKSQVQRKYSNKTRTTAAKSSPKTRKQKPKDDTEVKKVELKKGRRTVDVPVGKSTRNNKLDKSIELKADEPSTKKITKQTLSIEEPKTVKTRSRKVKLQESVQVEPSTRARRAAQPETITSEVKTRKRKSTEPDNVIPPKVSKSEKGRKQTKVTKAEAEKARKVSVLKENKVEKAPTNAPIKATRGKKVAEVEPVKTKEPEQRTTRGRKTNIENIPANQETGKRKRKTAPAPSPVKEVRKKQRGPSPASYAAASKTTGRSRRR